MYTDSIDVVMTDRNKEAVINLRVKYAVREDFKIAAELRGSSMSGLLHQFIVKTIWEEKEKHPAAFNGHAQPSSTEASQAYLFSEGTGKPLRKKRMSRAIKKDIDDIKADAKARTDKKLARKR